MICQELFYVLFKKTLNGNSCDPYSPLLEGTSESENHVYFEKILLQNTNSAFWYWTLDFRVGGGVFAFLVCEEHLLSQPHQEEQLVE